MSKNIVKNFKVSFRLQRTKSQTHPIQILLNLHTKDKDGNYIRLIRQTGITIKEQEWNSNKSRPIDSKLNQTLVNLEAYIISQVESFKSFKDSMILKFYSDGEFKQILDDAVNKKILGKPTSKDLQAEQIRNISSSNFNNSVYYVKDRIQKENLRMVNPQGMEIDLDKFFDYWYAFNGAELIMKNPGIQKEDSISDEISLLESDPNPIPFYTYVLQVAEKKIKRDVLDDNAGYKSLSNKFKIFNSTITIKQYTDEYSINFLEWLKEILKTKNNYGKYIKNLKSVIFFALDEDRYKIDCRPSSSIYSSVKEDVMHPYLTEEQLSVLLNLKFKKNENDLEYIRDLALIASYTGGVRYGNWEQMFHVQKTKVKGQTVYYIESMSTKQGERKEIPLMDFIYKLIEKYNFVFQQLDEDEFNLKIKLICEQAGETDSSFLDEYVYYRKDLKTGKPEKVMIQKKGELKPRIPRLCDLIASHTMRRSFATNFYYHRKISAEIVKQFTGHIKLDDFLIYCKATDRRKFDDFAEQVILKERDELSNRE